MPDDDLPRLVHEGNEDLEDLDRLNSGDMIVAVVCPRCGDPVAIDAVAVARRGQPATIIGPGHLDEVLADHLTVWLGFEVLRLGDLAVLEGTDGLSPSVAPLRCPSCRVELLAVASFGEVQPARWRLVIEGLVPADTGDRAARPPGIPDSPGDSGAAGAGRAIGWRSGAGSPVSGPPAGPDRAAATDEPAGNELRHRNRVGVLVALALPMTLVVWLHATAWSAWTEARSPAADGEPALGVAGYDRGSMVVFITVLADVLLVAATVAAVRSARRRRADRTAETA